MRKVTWLVAVVAVAAIVLAGCGKKDAGAVVKDLNATMEEMTSYQGTGTLTLHTGQQPLQYEVEVWHQTPHYYRIALTNAKKSVTQIILKNDEGVFVLTPQLNKSFRFQSDWPERQGQAYLYHTLVQSVIIDNNRIFAEDGDHYVFEVESNLQNSSLKRQRVWFHKKTYAPTKMEALDAEMNVLMDVKFHSFSFNKKFEGDAFDMRSNMTSFRAVDEPAMLEDASLAGASEDGQDWTGKIGTKDGSAGTESARGTGSFGVLKPTYTPEGVKLMEMSDIKLGEESGVLLRYAGTYNYTLSESRPKDRAATALIGTIVDMEFAVGVLLGEEKKTLTWWEDGVEFRLSSADLPQDEMIRIAQSLQDQIGK